MTRRPTSKDGGTTPGAVARDDGPGSPVRRAPFADNPNVGARGLRTQQRILDAALQVFGESGYDRATLDRIGQLAGCSRVSIYQYFSGKDDMFRHLAGQVARQLRASMEALDPVTPDEAGVASLRAWVGRFADVHARYQPVFHAFSAAAAGDATLVGGAVSTTERNLGLFLARVDPTSLPPRQLEPMGALLLAGVTRALDLGSILRAAAPEVYTTDRVHEAVALALHRVLFGLRPDVDAGPVDGPRAPALRIGPALQGRFDRVRELREEATRPGRRALASLLAVADDVIVGRGYKGTRVDDVAEAAGVSRGAFYRYFDNIDDYVRLAGLGAVADVSVALADLPDPADRASLRRWLRRYRAEHSAKGAMIRIWAEAVDDALRDDRAAVFDWGRRRMVRLLEGRSPAGDVDVDGLVLLAMIEAFGAGDRDPVDVDAALRIVERGFLAGVGGN